MNKLDFAKPAQQSPLHAPKAHDSGPKHVAGKAEYIDDMAEPVGTLHAYLGLSERAHAQSVEMDLDAVREASGVVGVLTDADIPGVNDVSPSHQHDEPVFAPGVVQFYGQPIFAVLAETREEARRAAKLARLPYADLPAALDVETTIKADGKLVTSPRKLERGDVATGMAMAEKRFEGLVEIGGQDHFYLEGQISMAVPGEDDDVVLHTSTQHPSEVQLMVAAVLGTHQHAVTVNMRRMGGGFGGKETQGNLFAAAAALAAKKYGRAVKLRPDRDDDFQITGKRHDFRVDYDVGYDDDGRIQAVKATFAARSGCSADLSGPVTDRALFHCDNAYWYPAVKVDSLPLFT